MDEHRLQRQVDFLLRLDQLKQVVRRNYLSDGSRRENSAEHSWHLAMAAVLLGEHADRDFDRLRALKMLLVHDVVEIDAGDTYCYDAQALVGQAERERLAADRIFALLPADQGLEMRALWEEFEARETPEARFAGAVDCLLPLIQNYHSRGRSWLEHQVSAAQVRDRNGRVAEGSAALWGWAMKLIDDAARRGLLKEKTAGA